MAFKPGTPKPPNSGRRKGTRNRATTVAATLEKYGCDPIEGMILIGMDANQKPELRLQAFKELAQYRWPKLRSIDISGPEGGALEMAGDVHVTIEYEDKPIPHTK